MEALRKTRGGYRGVFTRKHTDLAVLLAFPGYDYAAAKLKLESLEQTMEKIQSTDEKILDMMSKDNTVTDEQKEKEIVDMSSFSDRFIDIKAQVNALDGHQSGTGIRASLSTGQTGMESCLPEELLRTWQRQPKLATDTRSDMRRLLDFMNNEVLNEQKINLARDAFGNGTPDPKKNNKKKQEPGREEKTELLPTAAALHRNSESSNCLFCAKSHESKDCTLVNRMSLDEKRQKIKDARACFKCLRTGHAVKFCRVKYLSCAICSKP
ncbi:unnamed protein product [Orchesella dallaii]|uniref:CCHC-type domain-containing protein n=1 Tax=Orchesella dallaii TaxID=48710 RepID=A0ABP1PI12_9HEXA